MAKIKSGYTKHIALVLLALILVLSVVFFSARNINESMFKERSSNINVLMSRITSNIEDSMQKEWNYLTYFKNAFVRYSPASLDELQQQMLNMEEDSSHNIQNLMLIDTYGYCYPSDGEQFRWRGKKSLLSDKNTCTVRDSEFPGGNDEPCMYFIIPFETPIVIEGNSMSHIAMTVKMEFVDSFFEVNEFGELRASFVLNPNGTTVYWQESNNPLSGAYNVLHALEDADFYYGADIDQIKNDIKNREAGCVGLEYGEKAYYLAYEPLLYNDWMSMIMIEQDSYALGTKGFAWSIIGSLIVIAAATLIAIIVIIMISVRSANLRLRNAMEMEQKANAAKTTFLASMSHDIRTPMNAIVGMTTLAIQHIDDTEYVKGCLDKVQISSRHLLTLINDVLDISKVESGDMTLNPSDFSLREETEHLKSIVAPQVDDKKQKLTVRTENLLIDSVYADKLRLNQIMLNILSNAVKYTPDGGEIGVEIKTEPISDTDKLLFTYTVSDTGLGISKDFQEKMYSSFAREDSSHKKAIQGTGLGLAICKQMVDLMGGTITCDSEVGKGTTFTVIIEMSASSASVARGEEALTNDSSLVSLEGTRILVAEDNDFNWEIAKELLAMHGVVAERAENGSLAVEILNGAEDGAYDMILMDIQMPVLNGYEATEKIRASERSYLKNVPIVAMTADAFSEDIQRCLDVGMNAHVAKPIDLDGLLKIIGRMKAQTENQ